MLQNSKPTRYGSMTRGVRGVQAQNIMGIYVPRAQRLQQKQVIEATHFTVGDEIGVPKVSVG